MFGEIVSWHTNLLKHVKNGYCQNTVIKQSNNRIRYTKLISGHAPHGPHQTLK